jgi:hypothetical protein
MEVTVLYCIVLDDENPPITGLALTATSIISLSFPLGPIKVFLH